MILNNSKMDNKELYKDNERLVEHIEKLVDSAISPIYRFLESGDMTLNQTTDSIDEAKEKINSFFEDFYDMLEERDMKNAKEWYTYEQLDIAKEIERLDRLDTKETIIKYLRNGRDC